MTCVTTQNSPIPLNNIGTEFQPAINKPLDYDETKCPTVPKGNTILSIIINHMNISLEVHDLQFIQIYKSQQKLYLA